MGYSTVSFRMILSYLEWLTKIFNDMKRCAVSLRQLSFLLNLVPSNGTLWCILACHYKLKRHSISRFRTRFAEKYITIRRNSPSQQPVSSITLWYSGSERGMSYILVSVCRVDEWYGIVGFNVPLDTVEEWHSVYERNCPKRLRRISCSAVTPQWGLLQK